VCIKDEELFTNIIKVLVSRILKEMDDPTDKFKKNIIMFKCWNTIRAICENPLFIPKYLNKIDDLLLPILQLMEKPNSLEFEDDVVEVLISTITLSNTVAPNLAKMVYLFPLLAKKFQDKAAQLYIAYNTLLNKGKHLFNEPRVVSDMIQIAIRAMSRSDDSTRDYEDVFMTEGVMILHLAIHVPSD
jgi:hypothetical protein